MFLVSWYTYTKLTKQCTLGGKRILTDFSSHVIDILMHFIVHTERFMGTKSIYSVSLQNGGAYMNTEGINSLILSLDKQLADSDNREFIQLYACVSVCAHQDKLSVQ